MLLALMSTAQMVYAGTIADRTTDTNNIAPVASFDVIKKTPVDIVVLTDYTGSKLTNLRDKMTGLNIKLSKTCNTQVNYIDNSSAKISTGTKNDYIAMRVYDRQIHMKYDFKHEENNAYGSFEIKNSLMAMTLEAVALRPEEPIPTQTLTVPDMSLFRSITTSYNDTYDAGSETKYYFQGYPGGANLLSYYWNKVGGLSYHQYRTNWSIQLAEDKYKYYTTVNSDNKYTSNVASWDINAAINSFNVRPNSDVTVIFALEKEDTNYYTAGTYNPNNENNFRLGNLRGDNLGNFIKNNSAKVYSLDSTSLDNILINFDTANTSLKQDISVNGILNSYTDKKKIFAPSDVDSLVDYMYYDLGTVSPNIDLVVASNKGGVSNNFISDVKANLGDPVKINSLKLDPEDALITDYKTDKKLDKIK
ncbi:MAG: hypothetical protein H7Y18_01645, partial [Clostridiaceae bacterium]|nr:hypothetical protein [Clostridiaceae bacterium]